MHRARAPAQPRLMLDVLLHEEILDSISRISLLFFGLL